MVDALPADVEVRPRDFVCPRCGARRGARCHRFNGKTAQRAHGLRWEAALRFWRAVTFYEPLSARAGLPAAPQGASVHQGPAPAPSSRSDSG